ncbi:sperm surface protein Sp17-like [Clytia hemisphaerica]|uniref:RIIa domain-containing protein n=1 Tax=Clytia hemisphaerica TaxID=252671 RepID=A0A7M5XP91_9CNID|eukprot:TCONS_00068963-protein
MAVQYAPQKLTVPDGFNNLLEGLAREVLREQPENIIKFAADYFKQQVATRVANGGEPLPPRPQVKSQPMSDQKEEAAPSPPPSAKEPTPPPPQDIATEEVQSTDVDEDKEQDSPRLTEEQAATKIQAMVRGKKARGDVEALKASKSQTDEETPQASATENESEKERSNTDTEAEDQVQSDATAPESEPAANESQTEESEVKDGAEVEEATEEELTGAALKIQATFRGSKARKAVAAQKESLNNVKTTEEGDEDKNEEVVNEDKKEEVVDEEAKPAPPEEEGGN